MSRDGPCATIMVDSGNAGDYIHCCVTQNRTVRMESESSATGRLPSIRGLGGKMKHTETGYLWTQERFALDVSKWSNHEIQRHRKFMNQEFGEGRAMAAKRVGNASTAGN